MEAARRFGYRRYEEGSFREIDADVIAEATVTLAVNGRPWLSFLCTPRDLEALGAGFLYNEGVISSKDEIGLVDVCGTRRLVDIWLTRDVERPTNWLRTSGCTGGFSSNRGEGETKPEYAIDDGGLVMTPAEVTGLVERLSQYQELYRATGGVHTSVLADRDRVLLSVEDIGRHNTLDKIAGRCLLDGVAPAQRVLLTTGRVSSEMIQKAARFGAAMVISRTSPTALSVELAERWGVTLIGYARPHRFDVYSHAERVANSPDSG
jgi:FdhD protein